MAGTIVADTIQADSTSTLVLKNGVANTPPTIQDSAGTQIGTFCRAWVNFNGTGTVAIRASFNVSSITDNGTANYTVNFTNAMPDTNYCIVASGTNAESSGPYVLVPNTYADVEYAPTTTSCRVGALVPAVSWSKDQKYSYVSIFR
jgi:hypothetical protein